VKLSSIAAGVNSSPWSGHGCEEHCSAVLVRTGLLCIPLAAALVFASCSSAGSTIDGKVLRAEMDPSGELRALTIRVFNAANKPIPVDFFVRSHDGEGTFWDAENFSGALPAGSTRILTLEPETYVLRPRSGETISVYAVHRDTGAENMIGSALLGSAPVRLVNASLGAWHADGSAPIGWLPSAGTGDETVTFRPVTLTARPGVRISIESGATGNWHTAFLQQAIPADSGKFEFSLAPNVDCDGAQPNPRSLAGLEFVDGSGNSMIFCVSPAVRRQQIRELASGQQLVVVDPGRLREWNTVLVDLDAYKAFVRLRADKHNAITLRLIVAINPSRRRGGGRFTSSAVFGALHQIR